MKLIPHRRRRSTLRRRIVDVVATFFATRWLARALWRGWRASA